jgi:hypothetical protein
LIIFVMRYHFYLFGLSVAFAFAQDAYTLGGVKNLSDISGVSGATFSEGECAFLENRFQKAWIIQKESRDYLGRDYTLQDLAQQDLDAPSIKLESIQLESVKKIEQHCLRQNTEFDKEDVKSKVESFITSVWQDDQGQNQFPTDDNGKVLSNERLGQRLASYLTPVAKGLSGETQQFKDWLKAAEAELRRTSAVVRTDALYTVAKKYKGAQDQQAFVNAVTQDYNSTYTHLPKGWTTKNLQALADAQNYPKRGDLRHDVREAWLKGDNSLVAYQRALLRSERGVLDFYAVDWSQWRPDSERWRGLLGHVIAQTQSGVDNCDVYVDGQLKTDRLKINYAALFDSHIRQELEALTSFPAAPFGVTIEGLIRQKNWDQISQDPTVPFFLRLKNTDLILAAEMRDVLYYITQQPNAQDLWDGVNAAIGSNFGSCSDAKRGSWDDAKRFLALERAQKKNAGGDQRKNTTLLLLKTFFEETLRQNYAQEFPREREALEACLFLSNNVAGLIPYFSFIKQNSPACGDLNDTFLPENLFKIFLPSAPSVLLDYLSGHDAWKDLIQETPRVQMALNLDPDLMAECFKQNHTAFMPEAPVGDMVINFPEVEAKRQMVTELINLGIFVKA